MFRRFISSINQVRFVRDIRKYWPYAVHSARASLKAEVAGSYLNWLWWILNPISFMIIYTLIFGVIFQASEPFFPIYVFIGLTMWDFFSRVVTHSVRMVKNNKNIVSKVYIPKFILILSDMIVNAIKMGISFGVVAVMMIVYRTPLTWDTLFIVPVLLGMFMLTFAVGNLVMHFGVYIQDLPNIINIVLRLVFYCTGIFYDIEKRIPVPYNYWVLRINPMAAYITQARYALLYGRITHWGLLYAWIGLALLLAVLSVRVVYKNENGYVKVI